MQILSTNNNLKFKGKYDLSNYKACLKGGAIGDALGWPVEFKELNSIKHQYGESGIQDLIIKSSGKAEITDDTQMTVFTADGLIKSIRKVLDKTKHPDFNMIFDSYKLWFNTQSYAPKIPKGKGWISEIRELYVRRAPGNTCTSSLYNGIPGSIEKPINHSSGCGGVMRVAPVGLMYYENPEKAFDIGARCAALTHGHPQGHLSAGFLSSTIAHIIGGKNIDEAVDASIKTLKKYNGHESTLKLINQAKHFAKSDIPPEDAIKALGEGWEGHEAIAISTYCALKEPNNFEKALKMAVNHSGDSDSTGAIVGNILGAQLGIEGVPQKWNDKTELAQELEQIARDLYNPFQIKDVDTKYPI